MTPTTTIRDVAARAAVSAATVSRVLNGRVDVAPDLRDRVLAAVAALNYRPNGAARSLRTRATTVLGVIISDITNPFFTSMVRGVEDAAQEAGYSVVLANTDEDLDKERRYVEVAAAEQMAGVVLSPASSSHTSISYLVERNIPVVTIDRRLRGAPVDSVTVNNFRAAFEATEHLIAQGCRRIGFVAGPVTTTTGSRRLAGYKAALRAAGLPDDADLVVNGDFRIDGGRAAAAELLEQQIDGLFVANNLMTIGALEELGSRGVEPGRDLAVVGFDDINWGTALRPPLTAVSQPTYEIGQRTAELLLRRIRGEQLPLQRIVLPAKLVIRASSIRVR
ncbi:MAG TPA: LacI family DNA-binding transcriptional regulator [Mycobacteriales bacterium]|jgi:LacI family transcriptional regulator|nr:LacI family DNA-binding transcriptional regulator [Mycobacteriales bacterium]